MADNEPIITPAPDGPDWSAHAAAPADAASLVALAGADPEGMTGPALVDAIVASEKALSFAPTPPNTSSPHPPPWSTRNPNHAAVSKNSSPTS